MSDQEDSNLERARVELAASLGAGYVALTQMLQLSALSSELLIALYCFAASIPLLSLGLMGTWRRAAMKRTNVVYAFELIGQVFLAIGVVMIFAHFSYGAAAAFVITCLAGWLIASFS